MFDTGLISVVDQTKFTFWRPNHYSEYKWIIQWWFWNIHLSFERNFVDAFFCCFFSFNISFSHAILFIKSDGWSIVLVTNKTPSILYTVFFETWNENLNKMEIGKKLLLFLRAILFFPNIYFIHIVEIWHFIGPFMLFSVWDSVRFDRQRVKTKNGKFVNI